MTRPLAQDRSGECSAGTDSEMTVCESVEGVSTVHENGPFGRPSPSPGFGSRRGVISVTAGSRRYRGPSGCATWCNRYAT
jgi:hypothetical protein